MDGSPDDRRDAFRRFMQSRGLKVGPWAKRAGVSANSIYNFLNGRSDSLSVMAYGKLARVEQAAIWQLTGQRPDPPSPTSVRVTGHVQAGAFQEALEWDEAESYPVDVPIPQRFRQKARALEVRGSSMNLTYREGAVVVWVPMLDARPPRHGDRVVVYRKACDGKIEATVKELRAEGGKQWLWPRSDDPAHQQPIDPSEPGEGIEEVEIVGLVIGSYQPEIM